jgi:hypothetical protein
MEIPEEFNLVSEKVGNPVEAALYSLDCSLENIAEAPIIF